MSAPNVTGNSGSSVAAKPAPIPQDPRATARYQNNPFNINSQDPAEAARANAYNAQMDQSTLANAGMPQIPGFQSSQNPDGTLKSPYQFKAQNIDMPNINQAPLQELEHRAMDTGPSAWLGLQLQQQGQQQNSALSDAANQNAANTAAAKSQLASQGGLSSGARERLAMGGSKSANASMQGIRNTGMQNQTNLQIADESNKTNLLSQLPGMEIANAAPTTAAQEYNTSANNAAGQYNISNSLNNLLQQNASNLNTYNQQMKAWAAGKTADAQSSGGKK